MKLTKVHRVVRFKQAAFLKPFIEQNIKLRQAAKDKQDEAGELCFKLFSNAIFGKCIEQVRRRKDIELVQNQKTFLRRVSKPSFKNSKNFHHDLAAVRCSKKCVTLDKHIIAGFLILELAE